MKTLKAAILQRLLKEAVDWLDAKDFGVQLRQKAPKEVVAALIRWLDILKHELKG